MKKIVSILVWLLILGFLGAAWVHKQANQAVPILAYHEISEDDGPYGISPAAFEQQLKYLQNQGYHTISLQEFFAARQSGQALPDKPVILTFDDGYRNNLTDALPLVQKYGYKFTVFMISGKVGQENFLNWSELSQLQQQGVEIGSHTVHHVALAEASPDEKLQELVGSKTTLQQELGSEVNFLAYPYGSHKAAIAEAMEQAGYLGGCTGKPGLNDAGTPAYLLKRINIPRPKFGLWEFRLRLWRSELLYAWQKL